MRHPPTEVLLAVRRVIVAVLALDPVHVVDSAVCLGRWRRRGAALARAHDQGGLAGGRQHRDARRVDRARPAEQSAASGSLFPPVLQCAERAHGPAPQVSERRLRSDRRCAQGLHRHEPACDRERQRDHRDLARQPAGHGDRGRKRRGHGHRRAQGSGAASCRDAARRFVASRGGRLGGGDRQSVRTCAHGHGRHRERPRAHRHQSPRL